MIKHARWYVNTSKWKPTRNEWLRLNASIADEEVDRVGQFVYQDDSKTALIGRALIRKFVAYSLNVPSNQVVFSRNSKGRPTVCQSYKAHFGPNWPPLFDFNVSHSGDYCILVGCWAQEYPANLSAITVGADVMKIIDKTGPELERFLDLMSRRPFTKDEWNTVEQVENEIQKCLNFTRLWCLKESYIKSVGLGLSFGLHRLDFRTSLSSRFTLSIERLRDRFLLDTTVLLDGQAERDWVFMETALDTKHLTAIGYHLIQNGSSQLDDKYMRQLVDESYLFEELSIESLLDGLELIRPLDESVWTNFAPKRNRAAG